MLCPRKGCCQLRNCFSLAATQPILDPASPGFGIIHMLSKSPSPASLELAAQFNATPPPNTKLRSANIKLLAGRYDAALLHKFAKSSSVKACIDAAMSIGSASGIQLPTPLCKLCVNSNGILLFINSLCILSLYIGLPYAAIPIRIYSSSAGFSPTLWVKALYNTPIE